MEDIITLFNQCKLSDTHDVFNNIFNVSLDLNKDSFTKQEVIELLNQYNNDLHKKLYYYIQIIEESHKLNSYNRI